MSLGMWGAGECLVLAEMIACTVERMWHIYDSQGQILALASRHKSLKPFKFFSLFPKAGCGVATRWTHSRREKSYLKCGVVKYVRDLSRSPSFKKGS